MPAGVVPSRLPDPGISAGLKDLRGLKREVRAIRAIEWAAKRAAARAQRTRQLAGALSSGAKIGRGGAGFGQLVQGSPHVVGIRIAAALVARMIAAVMSQQDVPEIARLSAAAARAGESFQRALFAVLEKPIARYEEVAQALAEQIRRISNEVMARATLALNDTTSAWLTALDLGKALSGPGGIAAAGALRAVPGIGPVVGLLADIARAFGVGLDLGVEAAPGGEFEKARSSYLEKLHLLRVEQENRYLENARSFAMKEVSARATAAARDAIDGATEATEKSLAKLERETARLAGPEGLGDRLAEILAPAKTATDSLNEALELDIELIGKAMSDAGRAARIQLAARLAIVGATAIARAVIAVTKGIAEAATMNFVSAGAHFAAAGLYVAAAALAGVAAARPSMTDDDRGRGEDRSGGFGREAELVVIVPGFADSEMLREEIVKAVNADVPRGGIEIRAPRLSRAGVDPLASLENIGAFYEDIGRARIGSAWRRHPARGFFRALGRSAATISPYHREVLRGYGKAEREIRRVRKRVEREYHRTTKRIRKALGF